MKVVFIVPADDLRRKWFYRVGNKIYGHTNAITGPLILGAILKRAGHEVEVYEELYEDFNPSVVCSADVIGIYTMTACAPRAYELADRFRREGKRVLIGGIHASALPEEALRHADQVVVGEGELVIQDIVEGKITDRIVRAPCPKDLDVIPFPDYSLLKNPVDVANLMTTRGCPFSCSFCTTSRMFHPYRERSVDNVIAEIQYYKDQGFRYINFEDDNFTANKDRTKAILRRMIEKGLVFKETFFFGRTDMAQDEELLELLHDAHLSRVLVGIESLNQDALNTINKRQKISDIEACGAALAKHKIRLIASLVLGIDDDSAEDIRRGVDFAKKIGAYQLQPAVLTPFPDTPVFEQFTREGRMFTENRTLFDMMNVTFIPRKMTPWELQNEFFNAVTHFYDFHTSFRIMRTFGFNAGIRRLGLWLVFRIGLVFLRVVSNLDNGNPYSELKHLKVIRGTNS